MIKVKTFQNKAVEVKFNTYPEGVKENLLFLRQLVFEVAANTAGLGSLEETLKWGEPSDVTAQTSSGSSLK